MEKGEGFRIKRTRKEEVERWRAVQHQAFKGDALRYGSDEYTPENETEENILRLLGSEHLIHYTVSWNGEIVGGVRLILFRDGDICIGRLFIAPERQGQGFGGRVISELEHFHPACKRWLLNTPRDRKDNILFYERAGYKQTDEEKVNDKLTLIHMMKEKR